MQATNESSSAERTAWGQALFFSIADSRARFGHFRRVGNFRTGAVGTTPPASVISPLLAQAQTCFDAIWAIADEVLDNTAKIANCLRMAFHDAGARGPNGDGG